jgi:quercetin dioxygenase-like cupin family protein
MVRIFRGGKHMTRIGLLAATAFAVLLPLTAHAEDPTIVGSLTGVKWIAAPPAAGLPKGAEIAALFGDPAKDGQYANRLKLPSGALIPPHTHPNDENVTVLSGTLHVGLGDKVDRSKGTTVTAGGFIRLPKGTPHYAWATGTTIVQSNGVGPSGRDYLNTADKPSKAK